MTEPISPLGIDIITNMFTNSPESRMISQNKFLPASAGRIFIDIMGALHFEYVRKKIISYASNMDPLISEALSELLSRPEVETELKRTKGNSWTFCKVIIPIVIRVLNNLLFRNPEGTVSKLNEIIEKYEKNITLKVNSYEKGIRRIYGIEEYGYFFEEFLALILPRLAPGVLSLKLLERMEEKLLGTKYYVNAISKGLEGNLTTEMGLFIGDLADMVRKSPELIKEFTNENYKTLLSRINKMPRNEEFKTAFNSFLDKYGIRAAGEIDIARDRWIENMEPLAKSILAIVQTSKEGIHRKEYSEMITKANATAEEMVKGVRTRHGIIKAKIVKRLIKVMRNCLPAREHHKYLMMRLFMSFKKVICDEAKALVEKDQLQEEKDIFYVRLREICCAEKDHSSLKELVKQRKEDYEHFKKLNAPRVLTSDGEEIKGGLKRDNLPEKALPGIPVSSGVVEGIAKVQ